MDIQHQPGDTKGRFYLEDEGDTQAELTYSKTGNTGFIIDHTEVSKDLRGEQIGQELVEHAVEFARKNDLKVIPLCPFAKSVIEKDESLQDVLKK